MLQGKTLGPHTGVICGLKMSEVSKRKMQFVVNMKSSVHSDYSVLFCFLLAIFDCHNNLNYYVLIILV